MHIGNVSAKIKQPEKLYTHTKPSGKNKATKVTKTDINT